MMLLGPGRNGPKETEDNIESVVRTVKDKRHHFPIGLAVFKPTTTKSSRLNLSIEFYFNHTPSPNHYLQII